MCECTPDYPKKIVDARFLQKIEPLWCPLETLFQQKQAIFKDVSYSLYVVSSNEEHLRTLNRENQMGYNNFETMSRQDLYFLSEKEFQKETMYNSFVNALFRKDLRDLPIY